MFNNRLSGSLEYYVRKSSDVYGSNVLDPTVGFTSALVNYAEIENKGIELQLNATIIETQDFGWNLRANFNKNKNIITKVNTSNQNPSSLTGGFAYAEGVPVSSLWNYKFAGLDSNGEATFFDRNGVATHWDDARTDFEVEDIEFSGSRVPQVYGGLSTTVRYKGFDLTANLNFAADYVFSYTTDRLNTGYGTGNNNFASPFQFSNIRLDQVWGNRWRNPGDENLTNVPRLFYNGLNPDTGNIERTFWQSRQDAIWSDSDLHIHKGDYIRVQDIILGYTFSNKVLNNTFLNNLRLTMQVTNPFLWVANDLGVDPTAVARYSNAYTNLTRFTFGVRANF